MAPEKAEEKIPLTIYLSGPLALRLKLAATKAKRPASEVVVEILQRTLPRPDDPSKHVPYT
jgi:hypothetical protein